MRNEQLCHSGNAWWLMHYDTWQSTQVQWSLSILSIWSLPTEMAKCAHTSWPALSHTQHQVAMHRGLCLDHTPTHTLQGSCSAKSVVIFRPRGAKFVLNIKPTITSLPEYHKGNTLCVSVCWASLGMVWHWEVGFRQIVLWNVLITRLRTQCNMLLFSPQYWIALVLRLAQL